MDGAALDLPITNDIPDSSFTSTLLDLFNSVAVKVLSVSTSVVVLVPFDKTASIVRRSSIDGIGLFVLISSIGGVTSTSECNLESKKTFLGRTPSCWISTPFLSSKSLLPVLVVRRETLYIYSRRSAIFHNSCPFKPEDINLSTHPLSSFDNGTSIFENMIELPAETFELDTPGIGLLKKSRPLLPNASVCGLFTCCQNNVFSALSDHVHAKL